MKVILIVACLIAVTSALPTLSTMFPFLFKTRPPQTTPMPATIRREYNMRRTTNFFTKSKGKKHEKRKFHLQVSFGPIIYPEATTPNYDEEEVAAQPQRPRPTTTTEPADYEQIQESEEEILSEGFTEPPTKPTTTTTAKPFKKKPHHSQHHKHKSSFLQHLHDKFPKLHDWLYDNEAAAAPASPRPPRMPHNHKKKHHLRHPKTLYTAPKKPKHILTPPKKVAPKRRPTTTVRPRPRPTTQPPFEEEEDIQPGGQTPPLPPPRRRPTTTRPTEYQQFPAKPSVPFEEEEDIQPGGQTPQNQKGYNYKRPKISREIFFYEPPPQFAPSKPRPFQPKPPLQPKKQYKVIFIKAPEPEPPIIPEIPQIQPAPEQKTLIYVVAKTPEEPPKITIDAPLETSSTKPDVFFVRYKVTTPQPDESEEDIQPGGQVPEATTKGYKYPQPTQKPKPKPRPTTTTTPYPDESEEDIQPGGQTPPPVKPSKEYLPATTEAPEEEEDIQPAGQLPPDEYLPPAEEEEDIQPGGQMPTEPPEEEEDIQPGGQTPTTPGSKYLPPLPDEEEEDIQPAGQLPPLTPAYDYLPQRPLDYGGYNSQPKPNNQYLPLPLPKYGPSSNSYNIPITYGQELSSIYNNFNGNSYNNNNDNNYGNANSNRYFPQDSSYQNQQNQNDFYYNHKQPGQDNSYYNNNHNQKNNFIDQIEPAIQTYFPQPQPLDYNEPHFARRAFIDEDESLKNLLFTSLGLTGFR